MVTHNELYALVSLFIAFASLVIYITRGGNGSKKD